MTRPTDERTSEVTTRMNSVAFDSVMRDMYPTPGTQLKQWVVDARAEQKWAAETCPRFTVDPHDDNTGTQCRNLGPTMWTHLSHDCCAVCDELHDRASTEPSVKAWLELKAARPPICADRDQLSDEVQEDLSLRDHPAFAFLRRPK